MNTLPVQTIQINSDASLTNTLTERCLVCLHWTAKQYHLAD